MIAWADHRIGTVPDRGVVDHEDARDGHAHDGHEHHQFDEAQAKKLEKKIRQNKFDFEDFKDQLQQIKKMGNIKDLMGMIPGVGKMMKDVEVDDNAFKAIEAIIQSMTPFEKANPETINQSRRNRIAKGSGTDLQEVNRLMKQFDDMKKVMKQMSNPAAMANMMRRMPKM